MIDVDQPVVVAPLVPARKRRDVASLSVLVALGIATAALPWERWCSGGGRGFSRLCFRAGLWAGSASLFGLLAVVLGVIFVVLSIARGWARRNRLSSAGAGLAAASFAALGLKVVIVLVDGQRTSAAQEGQSPASIGVWLGLIVVVIGVVFLAIAVARQSRIRRTIAVSLLVTIALGLIAIPYAGSGLAWWGGPLVPPEYLGGGNGAGLTVRPNVTGYFDSTIYLQNGGRLSPTLDDLKPIDPSALMRVVDTYVASPCSAGVVTAANFSQCTAPIRGWQVPAGPAGDRPLGVAVQMPTPGTYRVGWFQVDYHVGPLHFQIFRTDQLTVCVPVTGRQDCPGPGLG